MIVVAGALILDHEARDQYLAECTEVVAAAREAPGCLDYALSADLVDPGRINVYELWSGREDLDRFRGSGPSDDQLVALREIRVREFEVDAPVP
jgi:quinol monooxygenase YgiN